MIHIKLRGGTEIRCDTVEELSAILDRLDADDWYPDAVSTIIADPQPPAGAAKA